MELYQGNDAAVVGKHAADSIDPDDVVVLSRTDPGLGIQDDPEADDDLEADDLAADGPDDAADGLKDTADDETEDDADIEDDDADDDDDDDEADNADPQHVDARRGDPAAAVGAIVVESFQPQSSGAPAVPMELGIPVASLQDSDDPVPPDAGDSRPSELSGALPLAASGSQVGTPASNPEWSEVKALFVDDPQASVMRAGELIEKAIEDLADSLRAGRASLVPAVGQGTSGPDTERLRLALRSYLTVFDDLERIWGGLPFADESDHHSNAQA
jgi:hypothetical protein